MWYIVLLANTTTASQQSHIFIEGKLQGNKWKNNNIQKATNKKMAISDLGDMYAASI
jgi:hypothetical protein